MGVWYSSGKGAGILTLTEMRLFNDAVLSTTICVRQSRGLSAALVCVGKESEVSGITHPPILDLNPEQ